MSTRLVGLDLLRSIIMMLGPTFHASMIMDGSLGFYGYFNQGDITKQILTLSHYFRIELFFMISGYFSSLIIDKKGVSHYISSRKKRIFIPTFLSVMTILPLVCFMMFYIQGYSNISAYASYRHLWFLVTLSAIGCITLLNPTIFYSASLKIAKLVKGESICILTILFCIIVIVFHYASVLINQNIHGKINLIFQISNSFLYFGPFITGMILYHIKLQHLHKKIFPLLAIFFLWYCYSFTESYGRLDTNLKLIMKDISTVCICIFIFTTFHNLKLKDNKFTTELSKIALPFYLLHLPILILVSNGYYILFENNSGLYYSIVVIPLTIILTYISSRVLVKPIIIRKGLGLA
ncbi:acyltransferase family protein [Klebsiella quasipneumoniae]